MAIYVVTLLYPVASVCFIQAPKGLSNTKMAGIGNTFGMVRMAIAILATIALIAKQAAAVGSNLGPGSACCWLRWWIGGAVGAFVAARVAIGMKIAVPEADMMFFAVSFASMLICLTHRNASCTSSSIPMCCGFSCGFPLLHRVHLP
ncbi:NAD(P)(+) transhydrogenase (Re/Si-specific) subunit beta [Paraburkholderia sp. WSM4175]|uniref:NAD(P)(+) transhydrogenase (Re/Si-specific) subunit beta n=1 Tax=Paraburkholderia sp. WSM4175 TaxID=2991072 RepID=UPI003D223BBD